MTGEQRSPNRAMAPAGGSILQLFLSTLPLLAVMIYFLHLANKRPNLPSYNLDGVDDDDYIAQAIASDGKQIGLMEMLYVFMTVMLIWVCLAVYLHVFVPRRRKIIHRYLEEGVQVLGDVYYENPRKKGGLRRCLECFFADYAIVTYAHPDPSSIPTSNADEHWLVQKRVRTYQLYHRERVSIILLPDMPLSGQPKADIEIDVASYQRTYATSRDRLREIMFIAYGWIIFTLLGSLYILYQMARVDDVYENDKLGWIIFGAFMLVFLPLVALGGNFARWMWYKRWLTTSGRIIPDDSASKSVIPVDSSGSQLEEGQGNFLNTLCGGGDSGSLDDDSYAAMRG